MLSPHEEQSIKHHLCRWIANEAIRRGLSLDDYENLSEIVDIAMEEAAKMSDVFAHTITVQNVIMYTNGQKPQMQINVGICDCPYCTGEDHE